MGWHAPLPSMHPAQQVPLLHLPGLPSPVVHALVLCECAQPLGPHESSMQTLLLRQSSQAFVSPAQAATAVPGWQLPSCAKQPVQQLPRLHTPEAPFAWHETPSQPDLAQSVCTPQTRSVQVADLHASGGIRQRVVQPPQWSGSFAMSTQLALQQVGEVIPGGGGQRVGPWQLTGP